MPAGPGSPALLLTNLWALPSLKSCSSLERSRGRCGLSLPCAEVTRDSTSATLARVNDRQRRVPAVGRTRAASAAKGESGRPKRNSISKQPALAETRSGGAGLPLAVDSFLGRDEDLLRISELFECSRLVTLTGPPGIGKTRLATEHARRADDRHPGGTFMVALAPIAQDDHVAQAVATALGAAGQPGRSPIEAVIARITDHPMMLILDNCEHVLDACARLAATLIESCPELRILATSQERLAVAGEQVWALGGLPVPDEPDIGTLADAPAIQLFAERARAADASFELTTDHVAAVAEVSRRLDGIPLAIELAAGTIRTLTPAEIDRHLDDRFSLLTGGSRSALPRHQTLRTAVDWSYDLLDPQEQALLRRLSIFTGGATLDAVEAVCVGDGVDHRDCLPLLSKLVERSLVVATKTGSVTRYSLLETIRFYGRDRLAEAGEISPTATRHLQWCVGLAESTEPDLTGQNQRAALDRLTAEHDNLRAAFSHALEDGRSEQSLRMAGALALYWRLRGHFQEGYHWSARALAESGEAPGGVLPRALWAHALMAAMLGDWETVEISLNSAEPFFEETGDLRGIARCWLLRGMVPAMDGAEEVRVLQRAIALASQAGDKWCLTSALAACGVAFEQAGDFGTAVAMLEEAVEVARSAGDDHVLRYALISLGQAAAAHGWFDAAEPALEQALASATGDGSVYDRASALLILADIAVDQGRYDHVRSLLAEAEQDARTAPSANAVEALHVAARLAFAEGDLAAAGQLFRQEEARARERNATATCPPARLGLVDVTLAQHEPRSAADHLAGVLAAANERQRTTLSTRAMEGLSRVAAATGDHDHAVALARESFRLRSEADDRIGKVTSLDLLAQLALQSGQVDRAVRGFAAAQAYRDARGYARPRPHEREVQDALGKAMTRLGQARFDSLWNEGGGTSIDEAERLLRGTRRSRSESAPTGLSSLTETERQVTRLLIAGYTYREIARRLVVSLNTVKTHATRIYRKLSATSRSELQERFGDEAF